jgi:MFS family permease
MIRNRVTWLSYLTLAFYGYFLNVFGPITPYLKSELNLSYTISSLHFSAFALGMICAGLLGHRVVQRTGRWTALWISAFGISLGSLILIAGHKPLITISASFFMGLVGSLVLTVVPSVLADQHGEYRTVAISEANVVASIMSAVAPVLVGWFALTAFGWRLAIVAGVIAVVVTRFAFGDVTLPPTQATADTGAGRRSLPVLYWVYWAAIVAAVSVEFCMIFWSADYLETSLGMPKAEAARAVSLFLVGMILGRVAGSRLGARVGVQLYVAGSVVVAAVGFLIYWMAPAPIYGMVGLFITGLGVAALYPMILSLAIGAAGGSTVQASAFSSLASGVAILFLPLILGRLADAVGIHTAYLVVLVLLAIAFFIIQATVRLTRPGAHPIPAH